MAWRAWGSSLRKDKAVPSFQDMGWEKEKGLVNPVEERKGFVDVSGDITKAEKD